MGTRNFDTTSTDAATVQQLDAMKDSRPKRGSEVAHETRKHVPAWYNTPVSAGGHQKNNRALSALVAQSETSEAKLLPFLLRKMGTQNRAARRRKAQLGLIRAFSRGGGGSRGGTGAAQEKMGALMAGWFSSIGLLVHWAVADALLMVVPSAAGRARTAVVSQAGACTGAKRQVAPRCGASMDSGSGARDGKYLGMSYIPATFPQRRCMRWLFSVS